MYLKSNCIPLFAFMVLNAIRVTAQSSFTFIKYEQNHILGKSMQEWKKDLKSLTSGERKELNLLHLGGSHVQAGFWSHAWLKNMLSSLSIPLRGYCFFPYTVIRSNDPVFIHTHFQGRWKKCRSVPKEFCLPLGPSGVSASTQDSLAVLRFHLNKKDALLNSFNRIYILHQVTGKVNVSCTFPENAYTETDSTRLLIRLPVNVDSAEISIKVTDSLSLYRIFLIKIWNEELSGIVFGNLGANGASSESILRVHAMKDFMQILHPDWIVLSYGVNDVQGKYFQAGHYKRNYDTLIQRLKIHPEVKILITGITDNYIRKKGYNKKTIKGCEALKTLCEEKELWYWPLFDVMGGERSIYKWYKAGLAKRDRIHFTRKGYELIGELMNDAFVRKLNEEKP